VLATDQVGGDAKRLCLVGREAGEAAAQERAAGAEVVVAPAPDLSVPPWVPARMRAAVRSGSVMLQQAQTRAALAAGARVADVGARRPGRSAAGHGGADDAAVQPVNGSGPKRPQATKTAMAR
jgi:hypothetical protein